MYNNSLHIKEKVQSFLTSLSTPFRLMTLLWLFAGFLYSCSEEEILPDSQYPENSGVPVEILAEIPSTRSIENDAKTRFVEGDLIHVEASFYEDEEGTKFMSRSYKPFQMDSKGNWIQVGTDSTMYWPINSKTGIFKAFFIKQFQYKLEKLDVDQELRLSDITDDTDPLFVETKMDWGHRVNLKFTHLCTHLTFSQLDPDVSDYFWLFDKKSEGGIKNVFKMKRTDGNVLEYGFESEGDENYKSLVYVQRRSENIYDENNIKTKSKVGFHLAPGDYSNVELRTINNYSYLAFQSEKTKDLQANKAYEVDITQQKGITFVEDDEDWDDDETEVKILDPEKFLKSIADGKDYEITDENNQKRKILQSTGNGTLLLANVSFEGKKEYNKVELPTGAFFDGGNHYISNIGTNLFTENRGTIRHLGLKNINCNVELWYESKDSYYNRWGVICEVNAGVIDNIRIEDAHIQFQIGEGRNNPDAIFNIGTVAGTSINTITDLNYGDNITVESIAQTDFNSTVNIGGIIGQTTGAISDISPLDDETKITVIAKLQGDLATIYSGALAGQTRNNIENISLPNVEVDCSAAKGLVGNAGGLVGRMRSGTSSPSLISSCTVKGIVKGMEVLTSNQLKALSYTGGFAGYIYNYDMKDCRSLCSIEVKSEVSTEGNILYGVGGGFGRIISKNDISDNYIWGDSLTGPENNIGNFAGIGPLGKEWEEYAAQGNRVREFYTSQFIGLLQDDNPPTDED